MIPQRRNRIVIVLSMGSASSNRNTIIPDGTAARITMVEEYIPSKSEDYEFNTEKESYRKELIEILIANNKQLKVLKKKEKQDNILNYQKMYSDVTAKHHEQQILLALRGYLPRKGDRKFYKYLAYLKRKSEITGYNCEQLLHRDGVSIQSSNGSNYMSKNRSLSNIEKLSVDNESHRDCTIPPKIGETDMSYKSVDELLKPPKDLKIYVDNETNKSPVFVKRENFAESTKSFTNINSTKGRTLDNRKRWKECAMALNIQRRTEAMRKRTHQGSTFNFLISNPKPTVNFVNVSSMETHRLSREGTEDISSAADIRTSHTVSHTVSTPLSESSECKQTQFSVSPLVDQSSLIVRYDHHSQKSVSVNNVVVERPDSAYSSASEITSET